MYITREWAAGRASLGIYMQIMIANDTFLPRPCAWPSLLLLAASLPGSPGPEGRGAVNNLLLHTVVLQTFQLQNKDTNDITIPIPTIAV
jgi:hypothetical protein